MRIQIKTTPNQAPVPFNYQQKLLGVFHKWLGEHNSLHDKISLYSFSWLESSTVKNDALSFEHGAIWFIDFWQTNHYHKIFETMRNSPEMFCGMEIQEIQFLPEINVENRSDIFYLQSPMLLKRQVDERKVFVTQANDDADLILTAIAQKKLQEAGIEDKVEIATDRSYRPIKTKLVTINGINNKAFYCPVKIRGSGLVKSFVRSTGVGHSTGAGFGFIR